MSRGSLPSFPQRIERLSVVVVVSDISLRILQCGVHNTYHVGATRRTRTLVNDACASIGYSPHPALRNGDHFTTRCDNKVRSRHSVPCALHAPSKAPAYLLEPWSA